MASIEELQVEFLAEQKKLEKLLTALQDLAAMGKTLNVVNKLEQDVLQLCKQVHSSKETFYTNFKKRIEIATAGLEEIKQNFFTMLVQLQKIEEGYEIDKLIRDCFYLQ